MTLTDKAGRVIRSSASKQEMVAMQLARSPKPAGAPVTNIGAVAEVYQPAGVVPILANFFVELSNTCSNALQYIIGDPTGGLAARSGVAYQNPTGCSWDGPTKGTGVLPMKASFGYRPLAVRAFNYQVSTNALQFNEQLQVLAGDINGVSLANPQNVAIQQRNTQFNDLLLTLDVTAQPIILDTFNALTLKVLAGQTVTLQFTPLMIA